MLCCAVAMRHSPAGPVRAIMQEYEVVALQCHHGRAKIVPETEEYSDVRIIVLVLTAVEECSDVIIMEEYSDVIRTTTVCIHVIIE